jgi:stage V sporulation protein SpoVS
MPPAEVAGAIAAALRGTSTIDADINAITRAIANLAGTGRIHPATLTVVGMSMYMAGIMRLIDTPAGYLTMDDK